MVGADDIDDGYKPVDRLGVAGGGLAAAEINRVRAFLQSVTLTFSPEDPDNAQAHRSERLRLDARRGLRPRLAWRPRSGSRSIEIVRTGAFRCLGPA